MANAVAKVVVIDDQGYYLLLERANHPHFGNDADLPGGTVEDGEALERAAIREVAEETGVDISDDTIHLSPLYVGRDYSAHNTLYSLYAVQLPRRPEIVISWEHARYEWVSREEYLARARGAVDTFMHMVADVLTKNPYLTTWRSGRESVLLDAIINGTKTIEGRLGKGKFSEYRVGDTVSLRRDTRDEDGVLRDGEPDAARVIVTAIRQYPDFITMVNEEGFEKVIPGARDARAAADEYNKYYSLEDQRTYGVLAIEVRSSS